MNDHYYTRVPQSASRPVDCSFAFRGHALSFETDAGVFSRGEVDPGTRLLLNAHLDAAWEWPLNYCLGGVAFEAHVVLATLGVFCYMGLAVCRLACSTAFRVSLPFA